MLAGWLLACLAGWELEIGGLGLAWLMAWGRAGWLELAGWLGLAGWGWGLETDNKELGRWRLGARG